LGSDVLVEIGLVNKKQADSRTNAYPLTNRGWRELAARRERGGTISTV